MKKIILLWILVVVATRLSYAQEAEESIGQAQTYLEHRSSSLEKYLKRTDKIQQRLLKRLRRKEEKMLRRLAAKDSALYYQYTAGRNISFDSIAKLSNDSIYGKQQGLASNGLIDSLKGVQNFIQKQSAKLGNVNGKAEQLGLQTPYSKALGELQQKLNTQSSIDALIGQRSTALEGLMGKANVGGLQNIQKQVYYAKEKMKAWKELADDPDAAEEEALEYLQGTTGFAESLKGSSTDNAFGGLGNNDRFNVYKRSSSEQTYMISSMKKGGHFCLNTNDYVYMGYNFRPSKYFNYQRIFNPRAMYDPNIVSFRLRDFDYPDHYLQVYASGGTEYLASDNLYQPDLAGFNIASALKVFRGPERLHKGNVAIRVASPPIQNFSNEVGYGDNGGTVSLSSILNGRVHTTFKMSDTIGLGMSYLVHRFETFGLGNVYHLREGSGDPGSVAVASNGNQWEFLFVKNDTNGKPLYMMRSQGILTGYKSGVESSSGYYMRTYYKDALNSNGTIPDRFLWSILRRPD